MNTYDCGLHAVSNALALAALEGGERLPFPSEGATVPLDEGRMATLMAWLFFYLWFWGVLYTYYNSESECQKLYVLQLENPTFSLEKLIFGGSSFFVAVSIFNVKFLLPVVF